MRGYLHIQREYLSKRIFILATIALVFCYGVLVGRFKIFPYQIFHKASAGLQRLLDETGVSHTVWGYRDIPEDLNGRQITFLKGKAYPGLNLISEMGKNYSLIVKLATLEGKVLHTWDLNCFEIWSDFTHLDQNTRPKQEPGTFVHGMVLMPDGSLIFNHEFVGLTRISKSNEVLWQVPYLTHHSLHLHEDGTLWACGKKYSNSIDGFTNDKPAKWRYTFLQLSTDGEVLNEWIVQEVLLESGYSGIIDMLQGKGGHQNEFHMNDVEPIPDSLAGAAFDKGDVVVSLRDINTVFVYNRYSKVIRYMVSGKFVRQHDPDFIDPYSISIFDNKNGAYAPGAQKSRIIRYYPLQDSFVTSFEGNESFKFMTSQAGKHQYLPNGNILISETRRGRGFEIDSQGELVWEYINQIGENEIGYVVEVQRVPEFMGSIFVDVE